jgi:hypothetical protein
MNAVKQSENLNTNAKMSVAVASAVNQNEEMEVLGQYTAKCYEPVPENKAQYDRLFQRQMRLMRLVDLSKGYFDIDKELRDRLDTLQEQLDAIPKRLVWEDTFSNLVTTVGKNHMLDNYIAGSSFTQVGPHMGLISSVSYSAIVAADTMASHAGWTEAGSTNAPTFAARLTPSWSAASAGSKAASTAVSFTMTGAGTLKGAFLVLHTGAVTTLMSTAGTLFSEGLFSGGDQVVANGNVVQVSYSLGL